MKQPKILVIWSNYYDALAQKQLDSCVQRLDASDYAYDVETLSAGCYEIPAAIQHFNTHQPYDGYLPLGLLLKGSTDHYEFIWEHVKSCFMQLAMAGVKLGNGVISAPSMQLLTERVENRERVEEAFRALDYLLQLNQHIKKAPGTSAPSVIR